MKMLLIAGVGVLVAGLLAIGFGIPVKEFSFGNTLILAGAIAACTGAILAGLSVVVGELQNIARRLGPAGPALPRNKNEPQSLAIADATPSDQPSRNDGVLFNRPASENSGNADPAAGPSSSASPPAWLNDIPPRDQPFDSAEASPQPAPPEPTKPKRNLLFSSSSRKERERAAARNADPSVTDPRPATPAGPPPAPEPSVEAPPIRFDDAWPQSERPRSDALRRSGRAPSTFTETNGSDRQPPATPPADPAPVTVLKSGVVDGMAYSLYSDGSIEAQMPEGMMRFASIDELRSHLDHRP